MAIPVGVILIWTGTNAGIPSGWLRETSLDGKFPKAWGTQNPNVTGGSNTHTHTGSHSHNLVSNHSHGFTVNTWVGSAIWDNTLGGGLADGVHNQGAGDVISTTGGSLVSQVVSWASANNEPPYHEVIFIKPNTTPKPIASGICAHYKGTSVPVGWLYCDGGGGTPDLRGKYLKGAGAGNDAGTTGGGISHSHSVNHTHTVNAHSHVGRTGNNDGNTRQTSGGGAYTAAPHNHDLAMNNTTDTINAYTGSGGGSDTVEVVYKKNGVIKNNGGAIPLGTIALWLGSVASIPNGWALCDGNNGTDDLQDQFIKIGNSLANNNEVGGANTHGHTSVSHTHTATGTHSHGTSGSTGGSNQTNPSPGESTHGVPPANHTHSVATLNAGTATYSTDSIPADTVDNQPAYLTAAYIQLIKAGTGAPLLARLL